MGKGGRRREGQSSRVGGGKFAWRAFAHQVGVGEEAESAVEQVLHMVESEGGSARECRYT